MCVPPVLVLHAQDVDSVSLCEAQAVLSIAVIVVQGNSEGALVAAKLHVEERQAVTHHYIHVHLTNMSDYYTCMYDYNVDAMG